MLTKGCSEVALGTEHIPNVVEELGDELLSAICKDAQEGAICKNLVSHGRGTISIDYSTQKLDASDQLCRTSIHDQNELSPLCGIF